MKITFPHMGNTWIPVKGMLEYIGLDVIVPPPTSKKTLSLGVQHAPEFACLPLKINIGNFIEAGELGADTILMAGGVGPCRFGMYAQLEKEILEELGFRYEALVLEPPDKGRLQFIKKLKEIVGPVSWWKVFRAICFGYRKACLADSLEKKVQAIRPYETVAHTADRVFAYSLSTLDKAKDFAELDDAYGLAKEKLLHIPLDEDRQVLRIGLVGEIYTLLEPFVSYDIERKLGSLGATVTRSIYLGDWIRDHLLMGFKKSEQKSFRNYAVPYLNHFVGGHGQDSVGAGVALAQEGFDGIVQVAPLTCMPEIVAHTVFPKVSEECNIPVMTIYVDEQLGQEGINTRLEAFVDLLKRRKAGNRENSRSDTAGPLKKSGLKKSLKKDAANFLTGQARMC